MRKILVMLLLMATMIGCGYTKVPAGYVGVKVYLLGTDKGVDSEKLGTGRYFPTINEEIYLYPIFTKNYVWTADSVEGSREDESISFQTSEGLKVNADVGVQFAVDPEKANDLFQKYRYGIDEITNVVLRNAVRDTLTKEASGMTSDAIYGSGRVELIESVTKKIQSEFDPLGILVDKVYWTGEIRMPEKIKQALDAKIEATQRSQQRENELREAIAQAKIDIEKARGQAEKMRQERVQLDNKILQKMWIEKWDGELPQYNLGGNSNIMIGMPK